MNGRIKDVEQRNLIPDSEPSNIHGFSQGARKNEESAIPAKNRK
jgi:hypothetical protein